MHALSLLRCGGRACRHAAAAVLRSGIDLVAPPVCPMCGVEERPGGPERGGEPGLCGACRRALAPVVAHSCRRCGAPVGPHVDTERGCVRCRRDRFAFERVVSLGVYQDQLREAVLRGKRPGGEALLEAAAGLLWERSGSSLRAAEAELVLPVPQHWVHRVLRTHNPAEILARALARRLKAPTARHILAKARITPPQARLPAAARRTNLRGAFRVRRGASLRGCRILLVDDVLTTGATAHEIASALRRAGAGTVVVAVLARGVGEK